MYKIEKYLSNRGYSEKARYNSGSIIYTNGEETDVMLFPERQEWEIISGGPYLLAVSQKEPEPGYARLQAAAIKDYIENYMYKLRKDLLALTDPWEKIK